MKTILFVALIAVLALAQEDCVKQKCPNEYNSCVKDVFGCAQVALKCKNKCGTSDDACFSKCAYDSGNAKMIALYECGKRECPQSTQGAGCDVVGCTNQFTSDCLTTSYKETMACALNFFATYPECECVKEM